MEDPIRTLITIAVLSLSACTGVKNEAQARYAYLGLDGAIDRAMNLGLAGYNAADSANIDDQTADGGEAGTMVVSGQVDQGSSDNKGLRLFVALEGYRDTVDDDNGDPILTV